MNGVLLKLLGLVISLAEWNLSGTDHGRDAVSVLLDDEELNGYLRKARRQGALPVPHDQCVYDFLKIHPSDD